VNRKSQQTNTESKNAMKTN